MTNTPTVIVIVIALLLLRSRPRGNGTRSAVDPEPTIFGLADARNTRLRSLIEL
jgi:hypothetical protein